MFRNNPGTTRAVDQKLLVHRVSVHSEAIGGGEPLPWSEKVPTKQEAPAPKATPSSLTEICSHPNKQNQHLLEKIILLRQNKD